VYSFLIPAGLIIPLPVLLMALYVDNWFKVVMISVIAVAGAAVAGMVSFALSRWYFKWQQRVRLKGPLRELSKRADLLHSAFSREIDAWGGYEALLEREAGETIYGRLMGIVGQGLDRAKSSYA
jgi:hypothetical protein